MIPAALDHLWQSTIIALGVALLMPVFRKASAGVRYALWFAASLKFLVPFAALAASGRLLAPAIASSVGGAPEAALVAQATQPFSQLSLSRFPFAQSAALQVPVTPIPASAPAHAALHLDVTLILLAAWAMGCLAVLARWIVHWARVRGALRSGTPLAWAAPMPVLASSSLLEPGLIGLWRPVLLVPQSLPDHLGPAEIDAIIAHETCHLRRRDNLTAAIHMLVEALFWFHPLTWWIGARLIEERERACDEAVVRDGHDRAAYVRSLLESARLYLESPLSCVAGASGSNLKTRVETIMTAPLSSPLSPFKKSLLLAAGSFALATPVAAGLLTPQTQQRPRVLAATTASAWTEAASPENPTAAPAAVTNEPEKPIVLAQNKAVLAPALSVAVISTAAVPLAQEIAAPEVGQSSPATATPSNPVASTPKPADIQAQALDFVQSYAASTPKNDLIARWARPICIRVVGLAPAQAAAVQARIGEVANAAGVGVQPGKCSEANVEIEFTPEPQRMLDDISAKRSWALGDRTSGTQAVKTVTRPIQAWYVTNGVEVAGNDENGADSLKALVLYQGNPGYFTTGPGAIGNWEFSGGGGPAVWPSTAGGGWPPDAAPGPRQFVNVFVLVDLRRAGNIKLGAITDYVAMLTLSQPRSLDHCNALPSVTDLFAESCSARATLSKLTAADAAYLTALYSRGRERSKLPDFGTFQPQLSGESVDQSGVAERMARILAADKVAAR